MARRKYESARSQRAATRSPSEQVYGRNLSVEEAKQTRVMNPRERARVEKELAAGRAELRAEGAPDFRHLARENKIPASVGKIDKYVAPVYNRPAPGLVQTGEREWQKPDEIKREASNLRERNAADRAAERVRSERTFGPGGTADQAIAALKRGQAEGTVPMTVGGLLGTKEERATAQEMDDEAREQERIASQRIRGQARVQRSLSEAGGRGAFEKGLSGDEYMKLDPQQKKEYHQERGLSEGRNRAEEIVKAGRGKLLAREIAYAEKQLGQGDDPRLKAHIEGMKAVAKKHDLPTTSDQPLRDVKKMSDRDMKKSGGSFDSAHPRHPAGSSKGGEFAPKK